ncbi:MAG: MFS transporter, partial [Eggerthellaceae bacterium]|nr:MFS transporter [Eggerthellaceae bacterium]
MLMTIAQFLTGLLQRRCGVKATAIVGLALMAASYFCCLLLPKDMVGAMIPAYSVTFGIGMGITYNTVAATAVRWFSDRRGLATSIALGMMGGADILLPPVFGAVLADAGLQVAFRYLALICVPCMLLTLAVSKDVLAGYMADYVPTGAVAKQTAAHERRGICDLITTRDAWLLVLLYFALVTTYLV